jgi:hypothetical protein
VHRNPCAAATPASSEAKSSGLAIVRSATLARIAIETEVLTSAPLSPRIDPKSTRTPAVPFPALLEVVKTDRNRTPSPSVQAKNVPIATSSARARSPRAPITMPPRIVAKKSPARMSSPSTAAPSAPVKARWTERVAREDLRTQDDEIADETARNADERAREERVAHELVGEHQAAAAAGTPVARRRRRRRG